MYTYADIILRKWEISEYYCFYFLLKRIAKIYARTRSDNQGRSNRKIIL